MIRRLPGNLPGKRRTWLNPQRRNEYEEENTNWNI